MNLIVKNIKWIMLVSGVVTVTMFYGLFAPQAGLEVMFGTSFTGALETIIIRSWFALIGLTGVVLIYGAFSPKHRVFSLVVAGSSKLVFVSLLLIYGQAFMGKAALAVGIDSSIIVLSVFFLVAVSFQRPKA